MTVEEQKYVEECRKKLGPEQVQVIQMAFKYGLGIKDVRRLAIPKLNAEQMRQTVYAVLENVDSELIELCCQGTFDQYQIPEIVLFPGLRKRKYCPMRHRTSRPAV